MGINESNDEFELQCFKKKNPTQFKIGQNLKTVTTEIHLEHQNSPEQIRIQTEIEQGGKCTRTKRNLKPCFEHQTRESVHYNVFNGLVRKGEAKKKKMQEKCGC